MHHPELHGLYAITPEALLREPARLLPAVDAAIAGGARLLQYRDKWNPPATRLTLATSLAARCRAGNVQLIINDDVELAAASKAHGVHLGAGDGSLAAARRRLGPDAIVGATCGDSLDRAAAAIAAGADYVAFGRLYPSKTKPDAPPATLATLTAARARFDVAICAIGGIEPGHVGAVVRAGADLIAAIDGVFGAADVRAAAQAYVAALAAA